MVDVIERAQTATNNIRLKLNLPLIEISHENIVDLAILHGTDHNEGLKSSQNKIFECFVVNDFDVEKTQNMTKKYAPIDPETRSRFIETRKMYLNATVIDPQTVRLTHSQPDTVRMYTILIDKGINQLTINDVCSKIFKQYEKVNKISNHPINETVRTFFGS